MSRISRLAVLVAALASLFAVLSSSAGATTFTNIGGTNFTATGGEGILGITNGVGGTNNLTCTASNGVGTAPMGVIISVSGTINFAPCVFLAGLHLKIDCSYTFTPLTTFTGGVSGTADAHCDVTLATPPNTKLCNITGTVPSHYTNPISPSTPGKITLTGASANLSVTNATDSSCSAFGIATGTARVGHLTEQTITLNSFASSPLIVDP